MGKGVEPGSGHRPSNSRKGWPDRDCTSDHGSGRGEDPVAEDALLGHRLGFLRHRLQLLDQDMGIESAGDFGP